MAIQFKFRATTVAATTPDWGNFRSCDGRLTNDLGSFSYDAGPTVAPITDADNRVEFIMNGRATNSCDVVMSLYTRHGFEFQPTEAGRLTASAFFTPALFGFIACDGEESIFGLFDKAGPVSFKLSVRIDVRVRSAAGETVMNALGQWRRVFSMSQSGLSFPVSETGAFSPELMEITESRSFDLNVRTTDTVRVLARYRARAVAIDDSSFLIDAAGGIGLNVPMAVIRVDP